MIMHCTWEQTAEFQNRLTATYDWNLHVTKTSRQEEKFYRYSLSRIAQFIGKSYRPCKCVCIMHQKKEKDTIRT
jgi:hypothetical protein